MRLGLGFDNNFLDNHVTTLIAYHTIKHQKGHISEFLFECPLVNNTCSKWQRRQNKSKYTNLK